MRWLLTFFLINIHIAYAQHVVHIPRPRAKTLNDSATKLYLKTQGDPAKIKAVFRVVDAAIKEDSLYYDAWNSKIALQGQLDQYENCYATLRIMARLFPDIEDVQMNTGIIQYKTGRTKDAVATFSRLAEHYNKLLAKHKNDNNTRGLLYYKGIALILANKENEGKSIMKDLYSSEPDQWKKSSIGFFINSSLQQIIDDRIPGK